MMPIGVTGEDLRLRIQERVSNHGRKYNAETIVFIRGDSLAGLGRTINRHFQSHTESSGSRDLLVIINCENLPTDISRGGITINYEGDVVAPLHVIEEGIDEAIRPSLTYMPLRDLYAQPFGFLGQLLIRREASTQTTSESPVYQL